MGAAGLVRLVRPRIATTPDMEKQFHKLKVTYRERPIKDALSISLAVPPELKERFTYLPGQHLVFRFDQNGEEVRRTYSLSYNFV